MLERFARCNSGHLMLAGDFSDKQRLIIINLCCLSRAGIFQELSTFSPLVAHFNGQTTTRIDLRPKCLIFPGRRPLLSSSGLTPLTYFVEERLEDAVPEPSCELLNLDSNTRELSAT